MENDSLAYLLQTRDARRGRDRFPEKMFIIAGLIWVVIALFVTCEMESTHSGHDVVGALVATGMALLFPITGMVLIGLPLRQVTRDASIHASFFGGNCYQEILGTLLRPREILDQIARHSVRQGLTQAAPWVGLSALLWTLLVPQIFFKMLLGLLLWAPLTAIFIAGSTYVAQELTIWNSQLKGGVLGSLSELILGSVTLIPLLIGGLIVLGSIEEAHYGVAAAVLLLMALCVPFCRYVCVVGLGRLPHVRLKIQQIGRKLVGHRRNRWVPVWSENPIVVRERSRDASRMPGGLLGALLFQLPLFFCSLLVILPSRSSLTSDMPRHNQELFWFVIITASIIQAIRAGRRCTGAIVGEIENKTLESMLNTRLHAREYVRGWLEVATVPLLVENLLIAGATLAVSSTGDTFLKLISLAIFFVSPLVGASVGLYASVAKNRELASRRFSEVVGISLLIWLILCFVGSVLVECIDPFMRTAEYDSWPFLFLVYVAGVGVVCWKLMIRRIEITK